jgi:hypothetical protein
MSLFTTPEENTANPPSTWVVAKAAPGRWNLCVADGGVLESFTTKKAAEAATTEGFMFKMWTEEAAWYAGVTPTGRRSWVECLAEREATEAFLAAKAEAR